MVNLSLNIRKVPYDKCLTFFMVLRLASELWTFKTHSTYHYEMDEGWLVLVESISKADFPTPRPGGVGIRLLSFWLPPKSMLLDNLVWRRWSGSWKPRDFTHLCSLTGRGPALCVSGSGLVAGYIGVLSHWQNHLVMERDTGSKRGQEDVFQGQWIQEAGLPDDWTNRRL